MANTWKTSAIARTKQPFEQDAERAGQLARRIEILAARNQWEQCEAAVRDARAVYEHELWIKAMKRA